MVTFNRFNRWAPVGIECYRDMVASFVGSCVMLALYDGLLRHSVISRTNISRKCKRRRLLLAKLKGQHEDQQPKAPTNRSEGQRRCHKDSTSAIPHGVNQWWVNPCVSVTHGCPVVRQTWPWMDYICRHCGTSHYSRSPRSMQRAFPRRGPQLIAKTSLMS